MKPIAITFFLFAALWQSCKVFAQADASRASIIPQPLHVKREAGQSSYETSLYMKRMLATLLYLCAACIMVKAQQTAVESLPSIFNNDMVLQQKTKVLVWGTAQKNRKVQITPSWDHHTYLATADSTGKWNIRITTPAAGGPYQISFSSESWQRTLNNILIGEVWVCSGQSNMEMPLKGYKNQPVLHGDSLISDAGNYPGIRVFRVPKVVSPEPLSDCNGHWFTNNTQNASEFSAIAYQYALLLHQKLQVPVGIIETYWGGTAIQSWMGETCLRQFPDAWMTSRPDTIKDPEKDPEHSPSILYNSMIAPIAGFTTRGFIWYQGESNRYNPLFYKELMPAMVKEWREDWGNEKLPFYFVQIAPYKYNWKNDYFSAILRESQLKAMHVIPFSGMAVSLDAGKEKFIHPPDKTIISQRLSHWALAKTYHLKGIAYAGPELKKMKVKAGKAYLTFIYTGKGLYASNGQLKNFEMSGSDHVFYPAQATLIGKNKVVVQCNQVRVPLAVRYAFKNWVTGDLYNSDGLPASSFRTDDFQ